LLTLSSAGIGLIIAFQSKVSTYFEFFIWLLIGGCFLISIFLLLSVLTQNSDLIEMEINEPKSNYKSKLSKNISDKTKFAGVLFLLGALFSFLLAISQTNFIQIKQSQEGTCCEQ